MIFCLDFFLFIWKEKLSTCSTSTEKNQRTTLLLSVNIYLRYVTMPFLNCDLVRSYFYLIFVFETFFVILEKRIQLNNFCSGAIYTFFLLRHNALWMIFELFFVIVWNKMASFLSIVSMFSTIYWNRIFWKYIFHRTISYIGEFLSYFSSKKFTNYVFDLA